MRRSLIGLVARGAQGVLLACSILWLTVHESSDLAAVLTACTVMNLVSNAGIPTLFVRNGRLGGRTTVMHSLARGYTMLTAAAGLATLAGMWLYLNSPMLAICAALLLVFQSLFTGIEYWSLGRSNVTYDRFLRRSGTLQATLSLAAPVALVISQSVQVGVAVLAASYLLPVMTWMRRRALTIIKSFRHQEIGIREWAETTFSIGLATIGAAVFYGIDVFVLRASSSAETVSSTAWESRASLSSSAFFQ